MKKIDWRVMGRAIAYVFGGVLAVILYAVLAYNFPLASLAIVMLICLGVITVSIYNIIMIKKRHEEWLKKHESERSKYSN